MKVKILLFFLAQSLQLQSFETQRFDNEIDPNNPNYTLLNEGLFRAANEIRVQYGLEPFLHHELLQRVAESHATQMIERNFYDHKNPYDPNQRTIMDRVNYFANNNLVFTHVGENIANYSILDTESKYCVKRLSNGNYYYYYCQTNRRMPIMTYKTLAKAVVKGWLESKSHRENLLDPQYRYLGTTARLSPNPYKTAKAPFARLVQNFGG